MEAKVVSKTFLEPNQANIFKETIQLTQYLLYTYKCYLSGISVFKSNVLI